LVPSVVALLITLGLLSPSTSPSATPVAVTVSVARAAFSPNGDGRRDTTTITVVPDVPVDLTLVIERRSDGAIERTLVAGLPIEGSDTVTWRGLNDAKRHVPDGRYRAVASVLDEASGGSASARASLWVDTVAPTLGHLHVSPEPWIGVGGVHLGFSISDAGPADPFTVGFAVHDATGRRVARVAPLTRKAGRDSVTWDARNPSGGPEPNGLYAFTLRATDTAGNTRETAQVPFRLARPVTASVVSKVTGAGRRVALTFDDCGNDAAWRQILATLHRAKAGGSFFCVGSYVPRRPILARRTAALGITIGNHTWSHVDLARASHDTIVGQIQHDGAAWWRFVRATPLPYLRPPYGSYDPQVLTVAGGLGYRWLVLWNVDPQDWSGISASTIVRRVLTATQPGSIILLHVLPTTAAALPSILRGLAARHLRPVSLTDLLRAGTPSAGWWPPRMRTCVRVVHTTPARGDSLGC
jgi:peptidoglycan/xylan/chitin deacetylase (PgdA/CDA1 family)